MSDIDRYLSELRSHLADLDTRRADEIVAEARSHLESRVEQLRTAGVGEEAAMEEATRAFGDPSKAAQSLIRANSRHQRPSAVRATAIASAFAISFGAAFALAEIYSTPECWNSPSLRLLAHHIGLDPGFAGFLLLTIQLLPAAYLAGLVGGPRFWWVAGTPGAFWIVLYWALALIYGNRQDGVRPEELRYELMIPGLAALVLSGTGWLGARLSTSRRFAVRRAAYMLAAVTGIYALALSLVALGRALDGPEAQSIAVVVAMPTMLVFLAAARRDRRLAPRTFAVLFAGISAAGLLLVAVVALFFLSLGISLSTLGQYTAPCLAVAAGTSALGLLAALIYWHRTQPEPGLDRSEPSSE